MRPNVYFEAQQPDPNQPDSAILAKIHANLSKNITVQEYKITKLYKGHSIDLAYQLSSQANNAPWDIDNPKKAFKRLKAGPVYIITIKNRRFLCHPSRFLLVDEEGRSITTPDILTSLLAKQIPGFGVFSRDTQSPIYLKSTKRLLETLSPKTLISIAIRDNRGRWPAAEPYIIDTPYAVDYARDIIGGRWPEAEPYILEQYNQNTGEYKAFEYAIDILKKRWPEAEIQYLEWGPDLSDIEDDTEDYLYRFGRLDTWENYLLNDNDFGSAINYAEFMELTDWPELKQKLIANKSEFTSQNIYQYIQKVHKKQWPEAEPALLRALDDGLDEEAGWVLVEYFGLLDKRWPLFEKFILQRIADDTDEDLESDENSVYIDCAMEYTTSILKTRWPELEKYLSADHLEYLLKDLRIKNWEEEVLKQHPED